MCRYAGVVTVADVYEDSIPMLDRTSTVQAPIGYGQTGDGCGAHAALRSGHTGSEGTDGTQSADRSGVEPERNHPGRTASSRRALWEKRTVGFGSRCVRARWCTQTTRAGEWTERAAFLMAFETDDATVYQVRSRHRNEEVREVVPADYAGVMVTDRARSYDAQALSGVRQQKCLAHVLRSISEVVETKVGRGRSFGKRLSELLREAMQLRESQRRGEVADYGGETERLRREVSHHLQRPSDA